LTESEHISKLEGIVITQSQQIKSLEDKVMLLLEELRKKDIKKDSSNSSMPPSSDFFHKNTSLRTSSELKSGGQKGHQGTTLKMCSSPDKVTELKDSFCSTCGSPLESANFILKAKRQVIELPPIVPIYEEFRQYGCECPTCKHFQVANFPLGVNAPIQYGSSVETMVSYFSVYQYLPFSRLQNAFSQVFSLPLSQGTIDNILKRSAEKCQGIYQQIKTEIEKSSVVGSDETGAKVNGQKWWIWTWQNILNTFIVASNSRGSKTVDFIFENGLPNATLISDRWAAQLKVYTKAKQICLAHLLRDLNYLIETENHIFATQFKELLVDIFSIKKQLVIEQKAYQIDSQQANLLEKRINEALLLTIDSEKCPKTNTFQNSMLKCRNYILPCMYHLDIPPDNNGSERAIRTIKVKQKVSGQFKTGQDAFCVIRSVIDTLIKRGGRGTPILKSNHQTTSCVVTKIVLHWHPDYIYKSSLLFELQRLP
jgi:transposase